MCSRRRDGRLQLPDLFKKNAGCLQLPCVFKKESWLFAASMCVQKGESVVCSSHVSSRRRVGCLQLPDMFKKNSRLFADVFKKKSRSFAASRCVQEGESVVCSFHVCSRRRVGCLQLPCVFKTESRFFAASRCVQERE